MGLAAGARVALLGLVVGCGAGTQRPMISGRELYAQVPALQAAGRAAVGRVEVRTDQVLLAGRGGQVFSVAQVIAGCRGGDPTGDVDCTLALLLDQRFAVADHAPARGREARPAGGEDRSSSLLASIAVIGLGAAAVGGLVYGVATCEFEGCKAVFGVPLVLVGGGMLFMLGRD